MTLPSPDDAKLLALLNRHPGLKSRVQALADIVADSAGDLARADEAERRVIAEVRRLGQEALHSWAEGQIARVGDPAATAPEMRRAGKKTLLAHHLWHHHRSGVAVSRGRAQSAVVRRARRGQSSMLLPTVAAGGDRLRCGRRLRASRWEAARALGGDAGTGDDPRYRRGARAGDVHAADVRGALAQGLPIGSGEIESAHRYIVQQRLKRPGAWWTLDNAEHMLARRLNRANGLWTQYRENGANALQAA